MLQDGLKTLNNRKDFPNFFCRLLNTLIHAYVCHAVTLSDGNVTVLESADVGRKKNQVKRKRMAKTSSTKCHKV